MAYPSRSRVALKFSPLGMTTGRLSMVGLICARNQGPYTLPFYSTVRHYGV